MTPAWCANKINHSAKSSSLLFYAFSSSLPLFQTIAVYFLGKAGVTLHHASRSPDRASGHWSQALELISAAELADVQMDSAPGTCDYKIYNHVLVLDSPREGTDTITYGLRDPGGKFLTPPPVLPFMPRCFLDPRHFQAAYGHALWAFRLGCCSRAAAAVMFEIELEGQRLRL